MTASSQLARSAPPWLLGSARELAERIARGELSASEVCDAFIQRLEACEPSLNALTFQNFSRARQQARRLDERFAQHGPQGPLHGLPCTVKDCFHVQGADTTLGLTHLQGRPQSADGEWVRRLTAAGAVVLAKTNVPQLMLFHETDNPVYGRTNNPWNLDRTCGGSSGGEAAVIAAGGAPWGMGTDLGGSIRVPCHFCGIAGLKPTGGRLSVAGMFLNFEHLQGFQLQPGPMAHRSADVAWLLSVIDDVMGLPERRPLGDPAQVRLTDLRIGVMESDGRFDPSPSIRRVVRQATEFLGEQGATIVPLKVSQWSEALRCYFGLMGHDGGRYFADLLGQGKSDWRLTRLVRIGLAPRWLRRLAVVSLRCVGQSRMADLVRDTGARQPDEFAALLADARRVQDALRAELDQQCDVWISPPYALPAIRHGSSIDLLAAASYAYVPNFLDLPCGVLPASRVGTGEESDRVRNWQIGDRQARRCEKGSTGLPVGLQVVGRAWQEHEVLAVMMACERYFLKERDRSVSPHEEATG